MASQEYTNPVTVSQLLAEARVRGFTQHGEIYSVDFMSTLAAEYLPDHRPEILVDLQNCPDSLTHALANGAMILVPYDSDFNHAPCLKRGHKSHWALLVGLITSRSLEFLSNSFSTLSLPKKISHKRQFSKFFIFFFKIIYAPYFINIKIYNYIQLNLNTNCIPRKVIDSQYCRQGYYVLARHGKSRHLGCWPVRDLVESNGNLEEEGAARHAGGYVIPKGGLGGHRGIRGRALALHPYD